MNNPRPEIPTLDWPEDVASVPYWVFTDQAIYDLEQERIYRGPTWSFLALEAEIPKPYDYKSTFIGDTPVVVARARDGGCHAWVNRCAHRGALVCRDLRGSAQTHTCVYHQWSYDPAGKLIGVPFRKGLGGKGGYPADFEFADHGLRRLRVATFGGLVFASFSEEAPPLEQYLGEDMCFWMNRVLGKPVEFLGTARQYANANWKLYVENTKDPYHASLLHLFHATFGVYRSSMGGGTVTGGTHDTHSLLRAFTIENEDLSEYKKGDLRSYDENVKLHDPSILKVHRELEPVFTNHIQSIFPSIIVQQIHNTLAIRQILPKAPDRFELIFHFFGYRDDTPEVRAMRLKQANFVGPAGYISMEDAEAAELVQKGIARDQGLHSYIALGGRNTGGEENLLTEGLIRTLWCGYRDLMGL